MLTRCWSLCPTCCKVRLRSVGVTGWNWVATLTIRVPSSSAPTEVTGLLPTNRVTTKGVTDNNLAFVCTPSILHTFLKPMAVVPLG